MTITITTGRIDMTLAEYNRRRARNRADSAFTSEG
jgi:hypothetical protein